MHWLSAAYKSVPAPHMSWKKLPKSLIRKNKDPYSNLQLSMNFCFLNRVLNSGTAVLVILTSGQYYCEYSLNIDICSECISFATY